MRISSVLLLVCFSTLCFSQRIDFSGLKEEPIFKSKSDSAQYAALQNVLNKSFIGSTDPKVMDSLFQLRAKLMMNDRILGFRKVYRANPDYVPYENLKNHTDLSQIKELSVTGGNVKALPDEALKCQNLEVLQLVNTSILRIPRKLNRLSHLKVIIVFNNRTGKPLKLKKNSNVETLVIRGDQPQYLPTNYRNFKSLVKLDLSNNSLTEFPKGINRNKKLKELILMNNGITLSNNGIVPNPYLEKVDFFKNRITNVPSSIANLTNLKTLKFNYNLVNEVAPEISQLKKLENLSFYNNKLTSIPYGVYQLESLKEIDLYYNEIEKIEEPIKNLKNLEILYLAYNKVYSITDHLSDLQHLSELYLHDNRLHSLPENLNNLKNLRVLRINNNSLLQVPAFISRMNNLENLDLSKNEIQSLPKDFFNLQHLKILALVANPWDAETKEMLLEKVKELRAKDVVVHLNSFDETVEN